MSDRKMRLHSATSDGIEEHFARVAYLGYCIEGHGDQSFERLHERGGFSPEELVHYAYVAALGHKLKFGDEKTERTR